MPYNKILHFKKRFINILNFLGSPNTQEAAKEIGNLPNEASDGFHDAYLTAKLFSIVLSYLTKADFVQFEKDAIRSHLLGALFAQSDLENEAHQSIDNVFAYFNKTKKSPIDDTTKALEAALAELLEDASLKAYESFAQELKQLKTTCDTFIEFYEKNPIVFENSTMKIADDIIIEESHKGPIEPHKTKFLSNPEEKATIVKNGSVMINSMKPCFALVAFAEDESKNLACSAFHYEPPTKYTSQEQVEADTVLLLSEIAKLEEELDSKGYSKELRFFLAGCNVSSLPLALNLTMRLIQIANMNIYLIPSPEHNWGYCLVKLAGSHCTIQAGAELYDGDKYLCEERGISFEEDSESDLEEDSESSEDEKSEEKTPIEIISKTKKQAWLEFFSPDLEKDTVVNEGKMKKPRFG